MTFANLFPTPTDNVMPIFRDIFPRTEGTWLGVSSSDAFGAIRVDEWLTVSDLPGFRISQRTVRRHVSERLRRFEYFRECIIMAELPDGRRFKIDGNIRALAWRMGILPRPNLLSVNVHRLSTIDDVLEACRRRIDPDERAWRA